MAEDFEVGGLLPGESSSNRTFVMAAVGLGALLILSMACLAAYALWYAPRQKVAQQTEAAEILCLFLVCFRILRCGSFNFSI